MKHHSKRQTTTQLDLFQQQTPGGGEHWGSLPAIPNVQSSALHCKVVQEYAGWAQQAGDGDEGCWALADFRSQPFKSSSRGPRSISNLSRLPVLGGGESSSRPKPALPASACLPAYQGSQSFSLAHILFQIIWFPFLDTSPCLPFKRGPSTPGSLSHLSPSSPPSSLLCSPLRHLLILHLWLPLPPVARDNPQIPWLQCRRAELNREEELGDERTKDSVLGGLCWARANPGLWHHMAVPVPSPLSRQA